MHPNSMKDSDAPVESYETYKDRQFIKALATVDGLGNFVNDSSLREEDKVKLVKKLMFSLSKDLALQITNIIKSKLEDNE